MIYINKHANICIHRVKTEEMVCRMAENLEENATQRSEAHLHIDARISTMTMKAPM